METLTIEAFNQLLQKWNGKHIAITKEEKGDIDRVFIHADTISYEKNTHRIDDYVPMHALELTGEGVLQMENGDFAEIPDEQYTIPLEEDTAYNYTDGIFQLKTDRGTYTLEITEPPKHE